jgi:hypothetical protein
MIMQNMEHADKDVDVGFELEILQMTGLKVSMAASCSSTWDKGDTLFSYSYSNIQSHPNFEKYTPYILCTFLYFLHQKKITLRVMPAVTSAAYLSESHKELCPALFFHALQLLSCAQCDTLHENQLSVFSYLGCIQKKRAVLQESRGAWKACSCVQS